MCYQKTPNDDGMMNVDQQIPNDYMLNGDQTSNDDNVLIVERDTT
jgi:hypothetical protein